MDILTSITILVLAAFVGFEVISKVPNTLHTPLMSGTNAIHGIVLLGGVLVIASVRGNWTAAVGMAIAFVATLLIPGVMPDGETAALIFGGIALGTVIGVPAA